MATNEILQLVVFSIFFGVALTAIGKKGEPIIHALDSIAHVVLKMVGYVMFPGALGCFWRYGIGYFPKRIGYSQTFGEYIGEFYLGLLILWALLLFCGLSVPETAIASAAKENCQPNGNCFLTRPAAKQCIPSW